MKRSPSTLTLVGACMLATAGCGAEQPLDVDTDVAEILGGSQVTDAEYDDLDFIVSISHKPTGGTRSGHQCGATVIHPRWLLTAAHCFKEDTAMEECKQSSTAGRCRATIGVNRLSDALTPNLFDVERVIPHPQYDPVTQQNDIALVRIDRNASVSPVTLFSDEHALMECWGFSWPFERARCGLSAPPTDFPSWPPYIDAAAGDDWFDQWVYGEAVMAAGWGYTGDPDAPVSDFLMRTGTEERGAPGVLEYFGRGHEECVEQAGVSNLGYTIPDTMMCALELGGTDSCYGDSGGPLLVRAGDSWHQAGITSWGDGCGNGGFYTYIPDYLDWIGSHVGVARISDPALFDDTTVFQRIYQPGSPNEIYPAPDPITSASVGAGISDHETSSSAGVNRWTTYYESMIAADLASLAGSEDALDNVIVRRARLKLFQPSVNGLGGERGVTTAGGSLCLAPNTAAWNRTAPLEWTDKPDVGDCLPATNFGSTRWEFMTDYAGYARVKGDDLLDYVAFDIPARSTAEVRAWMRNGFTIQTLEPAGFTRGFGSSDSPFPPELTIVYDCAAGYTDDGNLRCVPQTSGRVMQPVASAAATATTTPGPGTLRIGGSSSDPNRALVLFDKEVIRTEIGDGRLVSARLEIPIDSTSGWWNQYLALHRVDAPWTAGPAPLALTPSAIRWTRGGSGVAVFDVTNDIDMYLNGLYRGPFFPAQEIESHGWAVKKLLEWVPGTATVGATDTGAPAALVLDIDR